ncbi:hypothetical protein [Winogradskya consettensis]|nr:hypothetical protein [Actinoplanes consettensis]
MHEPANGRPMQRPPYERPAPDKQAHDKQAHDGQGYDKPGYDRRDYDRPGYDRPGYGRQDFGRQDYDRPAYDAGRGNPAVYRDESRSAGRGAYSGREESAEGPIWTVPDLPDAVLPDLSWAPGEPPVRRQRSATDAPTQMLPEIGNRGRRQADSSSTVYVSRHAADPSSGAGAGAQ